jgi:hypothetical protein
VPGRARRAIRWLVEARPVRVSPLGGLAAAAGLAGLILLSSHALEGPAPVAQTGSVPEVAGAPVASIAPATQSVQFVLAAPGASQVSLVGDFNDWDDSATPLRPTADGAVWSVTVPLAPGRHEYAFVVDGTQWMPDPTAPPSAGADFGKPNSVVTVGSRL